MDLNLLRVFVAVYEEDTVTEAAVRLHMTQPSVTQALNRLRREAGDPLFVRAGRVLTPTRAAHQLYAEAGGLPSAAEAAVRRLTDFDPASTNETFRVALTDLGQTLFLPTLGPALTRIAPRSRLDVVNLDVESAPEELHAGTIDFAVSSNVLDPRLRTATIREDAYHCVARRGRFGGRTPSFDELTSVPRIAVKGTIGHTLVESKIPPPVDGSMHLSAFSAIPSILEASNLIAFVPRAIIPQWIPRWDLAYWSLPTGTFTSSVRAHTAPSAASSSSEWFTNWAIEVLRAIPTESTSA